MIRLDDGQHRVGDDVGVLHSCVGVVREEAEEGEGQQRGFQISNSPLLKSFVSIGGEIFVKGNFLRGDRIRLVVSWLVDVASSVGFSVGGNLMMLGTKIGKSRCFLSSWQVCSPNGMFRVVISLFRNPQR